MRADRTECPPTPQGQRQCADGPGEGRCARHLQDELAQEARELFGRLCMITDFSAAALSEAIHARDVSCREVMAAYLDRIDEQNPAVNAIS